MRVTFSVTQITCRLRPCILNNIYFKRSQIALYSQPQNKLNHACFASSNVATGSTNEEIVDPSSDFFAKDGLSFKNLGFHDKLCTSLEEAGFTKPAYVQELAAKAILGETDTVLAAETGSGKTLAYLAPLIHLSLASAASSSPTNSIPAANENNTTKDDLSDTDDRFWKDMRPQTASLIICPNAALCEQVISVVNSLADPATGQPLLSSYLVSSRNPPPPVLPDIVVTTPGALTSLIDGAGGLYGEQWTREGLDSWVRRVVLDEADLLLSGSFGVAMRIIMDALKQGDRERTARRIGAQLGISLDEFKDLPYHVKKAAMRDGADGAIEAGFANTRIGAAAAARGFSASEIATNSSFDSSMDGVSRDDDIEDILGGGGAWRRQYIFVAATMPIEGGKSVGADIVYGFPDAVWLSSDKLHRTVTTVTHVWKRIENDNQRTQALVDALQGLNSAASSSSNSSDGSDSSSHESDTQIMQHLEGQTLIFCKNGAEADATAASLRESGIDGVLVYHKNVPMAQRAETLAQAVSGEGRVIVCTDAAARGLDLPDVRHVIQADFASSAIDFLHRVGRTGRAGRRGAVTSLYSPDMEPLVDAIQVAVKSGQPVEGAFSRKRSFSKKFKRYGEFVPRGSEQQSVKSSSGDKGSGLQKSVRNIRRDQNERRYI